MIIINVLGILSKNNVRIVHVLMHLLLLQHIMYVKHIYLVAQLNLMVRVVKKNLINVKIIHS